MTALVATLSVAWGTARAAADPIIETGELLAAPTAPDGSYIDHMQIVDDRNIRIWVHSTAMNTTFPVDVLRPTDTSVPRPTLYLLNGAGGGVDDASWQKKTDALTFLSDKNINVVQPIGGPWSYYTDWIKNDPVLGPNKWKTYFTEELPPLIDAAFGTSKHNAIAGLSTSATAVFALAIAKPGLYKSVASYSGCAQTSDPLGQQFVKLTVETWGGGNTLNMWGPLDDPNWAANDPYLHAEALRGANLYISNGSGLPGQYETLNGPYTIPGPYGLANQVVVGGVIEAATNYCAHNMQTRLNELGIPATYSFRDTGTHSWGYWKDDLKASWAVLAKGLFC
ncbi:esterase family protein [Aldersonia sp. NBC_00410]|uniref:alpha/beta hydrolase n=1 Tax=Aldersonia sp. NBC_00410 TaxID=2975954 RepID=UPI00225C0A99|nr:alpha/beta hydrolase family protein [Aldersonia sp. NBC_00410]MCX5045878.1 esterase family protein [Aldersonia sp. NBC_00410]